MYMNPGCLYNEHENIRIDVLERTASECVRYVYGGSFTAGGIYRPSGQGQICLNGFIFQFDTCFVPLLVLAPEGLRTSQSGL